MRREETQYLLEADGLLISVRGKLSPHLSPPFLRGDVKICHREFRVRGKAKCLSGRISSAARAPRRKCEYGAHQASTPESSWTIVADQGEWFVRRVVYLRRSAAGEISHDTFASEAGLAEAVALSLLRDLRAISIPPFVRVSGIGLDGTRYGIEAGCFMAGVSLSWWGKAPEEWGVLRSWYKAAIGVLESQLPTSARPLQRLQPWVE